MSLVLRPSVNHLRALHPDSRRRTIKAAGPGDETARSGSPKTARNSRHIVAIGIVRAAAASYDPLSVLLTQLNRDWLAPRIFPFVGRAVCRPGSGESGTFPPGHQYPENYHREHLLSRS